MCKHTHVVIVVSHDVDADDMCDASDRYSHSAAFKGVVFLVPATFHIDKITTNPTRKYTVPLK